MPSSLSHRLAPALCAFLVCAGTISTALAQATTNPATTTGSPLKAATPIAQTPTTKIVPQQWWNDAVFYEIFVRSFNDSRTGPLANDGIGDIQGIIERLDYLNDGDPATSTDLGITGIWLMPINPSPSYHGYDVTDYTGIQPDYGTREDFIRLMQEAQKRGIRIIIDLVLNHCSSQHPWFTEAQKPDSSKRDWFIWADRPTDYRGPWNQRIWHRNADGKYYYYGIFSNQMPDLNYRNQEVTHASQEIVKTWLTELNVDGFRLDAIRHLIENGPIQESTPETHEWLRAFNKHYKQVDPNAFTIGEVWASAEDAAAYVGDQLDTTFDFALAQAILEAARDGKAQLLAQALGTNAAVFPLNQYGTFLTNHDQPRIMTQLLKATKDNRPAALARAALAAQLLMVMPGIPFMYYGEEIGMVGDKPDPNIRTPMQWNNEPFAGFTQGPKPWKPLNQDSETVESQAATSTSLLNTYKKMIRLRNQETSLRRGTLTLLETSSPHIIAFTREHEGSTPLLIIANLSDTPVESYDVSLTAPTMNAPLETKPNRQTQAEREPKAFYAIKAQNDLASNIPINASDNASKTYKPLTTLSPHQLLVLRLHTDKP